MPDSVPTADRTPPLYRPDDPSPPGATFGDLMREHRRSKDESAHALGWSRQMVEGFLDGELYLNPLLCRDLERVTAIGRKWWAMRERLYRESSRV